MLKAFEQYDVSPLEVSINIAEIGPGFGPITALLSDIAPEIHSFDSYEMQFIAKFIEKEVIKPKIGFTYHPINLEMLQQHKMDNSEFALLAFYSLTEVNQNEREHYFHLLQQAKYIIVAANNNFEGINNFVYLENLALRLNKECHFIQLDYVLGCEIPSYMRTHRLYLIK
jgi:hypothetical protein